MKGKRVRMKRNSRNTLRPFLHQAGLFALLGLVLVCLHSSAWALDTVVWKPTPDAPERTSVGKTLAVTQDKGVLLLERSGEIQAIEPQMIVKATRNSQEFQPFTQDEMAKEFLQRLPQGFQVLKTDHYTIFYETTPEYARWCGTLLERLYDSFSQFSTKQELKLPEPEFPLVVVMFANVKNYRAFSREELSSFDSSVIGYYSFQTNRMVCYDLSGEETYTEHRPSATKSKIHRQILKRPEALKQVATLIHEATHQLAYNRGISVRYGDTPLWFNEGLALYFETPDAHNKDGWKSVGKINPLRIGTVRKALPNWRSGTLEALITNDALLRESETAEQSYANAWALTWFLIKTRRDQYAQYIQTINQKKPLFWDKPEDRLKDFEDAFGPIEKLEKAFVRYMSRK